VNVYGRDLLRGILAARSSLYFKFNIVVTLIQTCWKRIEGQVELLCCGAGLNCLAVVQVELLGCDVVMNFPATEGRYDNRRWF